MGSTALSASAAVQSGRAALKLAALCIAVTYWFVELKQMLCSMRGRLQPTVEMRHLRYFVVAAEQGSFRKAAHSLQIQESSISRGIRGLEDGIGVSLFQRCSSGVSLTEAGESFLGGAQQVLAMIERESQVVSEVGRGRKGRVRIGIFAPLTSRFLTELIRAYQASHGEVQLEFIDGEPERHVAWIRQKRLDVAFLSGTTDWLECDTAHLWSERLFVILPADHELRRKRQVTWSDLKSETFIVNEVGPGRIFEEHLIRRFVELGHKVHIRLQSVDRENLLPLVALGHGLCIATESMTALRAPRLIYRPILQELISFSAVWSPTNDNPAFRRLLSLAKTRDSSANRSC